MTGEGCCEGGMGKCFSVRVGDAGCGVNGGLKALNSPAEKR